MLSVDLTGSFAAFTPSAYLAGQTVQAVYAVSNVHGTTNYSGGAKAAFYLSTDNGLDGNDILLTTKSIPSIKAGMVVIKPQTVNLTFPAGTASGSYHVITKFNFENKVGESNENNNVVFTPAFTINERTRDLTVDIKDIKLPPSIVAGATPKGNVVVEVSNPGGLALNNGQKVNLQIIARPTEGGDDVVLSTTEVNVSKLDEKKPKKVTVSVTLPASLPVNEYSLVAVIDSGNVVNEGDHESNNTDTASGYELTSAPAFADLALVDIDTDLGPVAHTNG